jgi:hypothetical protein
LGIGVACTTIGGRHLLADIVQSVQQLASLVVHLEQPKTEVMMPKLHAEYVVIKRAGQWWVTMDGQRTGPHPSHDAAVGAAITSAKLYERSGNTARVSVDEPEDGLPTVYETTDR